MGPVTKPFVRSQHHNEGPDVSGFAGHSATKRSLLAVANLRRLRKGAEAAHPNVKNLTAQSANSLSASSTSSSSNSATVRTASSSSSSFEPAARLTPPRTHPRNAFVNDGVSDTHSPSPSLPQAGQRHTVLSRSTTSDQLSSSDPPVQQLLSSNPIPSSASSPSLAQTKNARHPHSPHDAKEMKRFLNRHQQGQDHGKGSSTQRADLRKFAKSTADLVDSEQSGHFSGSSSKFIPRKSATYARKSTSNDEPCGYLSSPGEDKVGGFRSLGRKFLKPVSQSSNSGSSPYSWLASGAGRQGSYSSESTLQSSPPHTPTTTHSSADLSVKDASTVNGLPQLPPLSSLGNLSNKDSITSPLPQFPNSIGLATSIHASHIVSSSTSQASLQPRTSLSLALPTPARTSSIVREQSQHGIVSPLASPSTPHSPSVSSPLAPKLGSSPNSSANVSPTRKERARPAAALPPSSSFEESSDFLTAVLSFSEGGFDSNPLDDSPATSSSAAQSSSFSTSSPSSGSYLSPFTHGSNPLSGLPRRLTEAQLAQIEQEERSKPSSRPPFVRSTGRTTYGHRPGLFASSNRRGSQNSDSEDEYGEADALELDDDEDWEAAKASTTASTGSGVHDARKAKRSTSPQANQNGSKLLPGRKSSDIMSRASAFLKARSSSSAASPKSSPPTSSAGASHEEPSRSAAFPSSFARNKKSSPTSAKPPQEESLWRAPPAQLPGLNSPAKRALYACTLLKVHPQLDSILKVGVSNAAEEGELPGCVEIRYPRSINSAKKLTAASKFGGSQIGVAGAPITLGSRRLDVALAQTQVMRKLRRRLTRQDEVEIGWFLKGYASETISPETIAKSLAAKPQVSPEALAKPLVSSQEGEKTPLRQNSPNARDSVDSVSPAVEQHAKDAARKTAMVVNGGPNGLARWIMRKPFMERCVMIRGEDEPSYNVGDVVVNTESSATAIPVVSADTFHMNESGTVKRQSISPMTGLSDRPIAARPGDLELSARIRVLAGFSARPQTRGVTSAAEQRSKQSQSNGAKKTPPPWAAQRQRSAAATSATMPCTDASRQDTHLQAAHDRLVGKTPEPATLSTDQFDHLLSPAQAVAARVRASFQPRRGSTSTVSPVESPINSPRLYTSALDGDTDSNEASGAEYYSAVETEDDDDVPISTIALRRRPSALSDFEEPTLRKSSSSTLKGQASPGSKRATSPRIEEQQRIAALEQELLALKKREHFRESILLAERTNLAKMKAEKEAARKLEEQKRRLQQARERRSKTEHSEVLASPTYGAGDSLAWFEQSTSSRRLRQSASMADVATSRDDFAGHAPQQKAVARRSSTQRASLAAPAAEVNAVSPLLDSVPEVSAASPTRGALSPPARPDRNNRRQSTLPAPPLSASARASAALGRSVSPQPQQMGLPPLSPSQQDMRDQGARRMSSGSSASRPAEVRRAPSRNHLRSPSPGASSGQDLGHLPQQASPSRTPNASAHASPARAKSPMLDARATSPSPGVGSPMYAMPRGVLSDNHLSPNNAQQLHQQQQQWQQWQQWQQMQYLQQQHLQRSQSQSHVRGMMGGNIPVSASFGGTMGMPEPLVRLGVGDVPSSAISGRYREV